MRRFIKKIIGNERGSLLAETLITVSVFTLIGTAVMTGVSATSSASVRIRDTATADTMASNRLTEILSEPYVNPPYVFQPTEPEPGYTVTAEVLHYIPGDTYIARIVVKVYRDGAEVAKLESIRLKGE